MIRRLPPVATPVSIKELLICGSELLRNSDNSQRLEKQFSEALGAEYLLTVSSGRAALTIILKMLSKISEKREIIIPAYTCPSVAAAVVKSGLKVVLCDLEENGFGYDMNQLSSLAGDDTLAIICVHLFGCHVATDKIIEIGKEKGIYIIEDKAQAASTVYGKLSESLKGDIGFYSLGRGKNITTGGGGIIVTNRQEFADGMRLIASEDYKKNIFGSFSAFFQLIAYAIFIQPIFYFLPQSLPFLRLGETIYSTDFKISFLTPVQLQMGRLMIKKLDMLNSSRRKKALFYRDKLLNFKKILMLEETDKNIYLRFPVFINDEITREKIYEDSYNQGLGVTKMYPVPLNKIEELTPYFCKPLSYPNALRVSKSILTLPTHHLVKEKDMFNIIKNIKSNLN